MARLICEGLSDKEIARKLHLILHTAKDHLKKVYSKFRVHARAQLVSLYVQIVLFSTISTSTCPDMYRSQALRLGWTTL